MILKGKKGIIFGALNDQSLAWLVAEQCVAEGAQIVLTNAPVAFRMGGGIQRLAENLNCKAIPADATKVEDLEKLIDEATETLGGKIDFVLHSIGMSLNIRKNRKYTDLQYGWMQKTMDISAMSFHKLMQVLYKKEAMNDWGSILALTYIGAQRTFPHYSEMAEAKALLESFARSFGYYFGNEHKVRVNTISQSPTRTTAGSGIDSFDKFFAYAEEMSPLGNAPALDCAKYCISLFSDYTRYVTMQNLFHDGGFSNMGMSANMMDNFNFEPAKEEETVEE
ncbi:MAG: SDR family oxidoreductase [Saprospiraceae bacterium]|nr:SDR family oxidoreductase [Saprospiraceae bacterium]